MSLDVHVGVMGELLLTGWLSGGPDVQSWGVLAAGDAIGEGCPTGCVCDRLAAAPNACHEEEPH